MCEGDGVVVVVLRQSLHSSGCCDGGSDPLTGVRITCSLQLLACRSLGFFPWVGGFSKQTLINFNSVTELCFFFKLGY
jgi:hypothetical protein